MSADRIEVRPLAHPPHATIRVPGSKSITNRALLLAALAEGASVIESALTSDDSRYMIAALRQLGVSIETEDSSRLRVRGCGGKWTATEATLDIGNAGTAARFLVAAVCLGNGRYVIDGNERMRQRPIGDLIDALRSLGIEIDCPTACPPVTIHARGLRGGAVRVSGKDSSQFLSALLMVSPYADTDLEIHVVDGLIARPYVDMTVAMMRQFGIEVDRDEYRRFRARRDRYQSRHYEVEPDASSAHYFLAAAALTAGEVCIERVRRDSLQGDIAFANVLEMMGAQVKWETNGVHVRGPARLSGIDVDMNAISDTSLTLAAIAPFAESSVHIRNVAHIRRQESDRLAAVTTELKKLGAEITERDDGWDIEPSQLHGGEVETYDDHRVAMAFALIGLRVPGIIIRNPACVAKTYPGYFAAMEQLR